MATNVIRAQTRIANDAFFEFEFGGEFLQHVEFHNEDFTPAANIGGTYTYRRPGKLQTFQSAPTARGTQPSIGTAPTYGALTEPVFSLTVARKFRQAFVVSQDDLTLALTSKQAVARSAMEAAVALRHQIEQYAGGIMLAGSSQVIGTPGSNSTGATLLSNFTKASDLISRRGLRDKGNRVALVPSFSVQPNVLEAVRGLYNPAPGISKAYEQSKIGRFGNLNFFTSSYLPSDAVNVAGTPTVTVVGAYQNAGAVWTPTWSLIVNSSANLVIPAGTLFSLSNSGTALQWVTADTFTTFGAVATFRTTTDVTLDGSGNGTLVVTEPLIADTTNGTLSTNGYQNVNVNPANGATLTLLNDVATATPSVVFDPRAVVGVSPKISVPDSIWSKTQNIGGVNVTFIKSADPYNFAEIYELQAMVGFAVGIPEGVVAVY